MSTDFQKDLYKKSGSLLTVWDICIGVGLITLGSGAYIHFKDKKGSASKLSIGDAAFEDAERQEFLKRKEEKEYEEKKFSRQKEQRYNRQVADQQRKRKAEKQMEDRSEKKDKDALSKLGL